MRNIFIQIITAAVLVVVSVYIFINYSDWIKETIFGEEVATTIYVRSIPLRASIADESSEHARGLSGTPKLGDFEGMLFIFPEDDYYGMWMKDMLFPLDIIWIDSDKKIVHIEENVLPKSYPSKTFVSPVPARYVLEVNAFFASNNAISVGDTVTIPVKYLKDGSAEILQ